ncbi:MAG: hypothetical protein J2P31_06055, partial [Blastocatellia bacterium]|nr:hypothetical protein [Blastocatellia bacterium]
ERSRDARGVRWLEDIWQDLRCYPSYNVAKLMIEFSTSIPRERLQPGYGDGFYGAPLDTVEPSHIPSARDQGGHHRGKSRAKKGSSSGGPRHV